MSKARPQLRPWCSLPQPLGATAGKLAKARCSPQTLWSAFLALIGAGVLLATVARAQPTGPGVRAVTVEDTLAFIVRGTTPQGDEAVFEVLNVSDPEHPTRMGQTPLQGSTQGIDGIRLYRGHAYVLGGLLHIIDISDPSQPVVVFAGTRTVALDIAFDGDLAYFAAGEVIRYDLSDPTNPVELGLIGISYDQSEAVRLQGDTLFVAESDGVTDDGNQSFFAVDVSDPEQPVEIAYYPLGSDGLGKPGTEGEDLEIIGQVAYIVGGSFLLLLDLSDFGQLEPVATPPFSGNDLTGEDSLLVVGTGNVIRKTGLFILSVADPTAPVLLSQIPQQSLDMDLSDGLLYLAAERNGLLIFDLSVPTAPRLLGGYATSAERSPEGPEQGLRLEVFPNPSPESVRIRYETDRWGPVRLAVYDLLGREVAVLVEAVQPAGVHSVAWSSGVPGPGSGSVPRVSGVYFCRLETGEHAVTRSITIMH